MGSAAWPEALNIQDMNRQHGQAERTGGTDETDGRSGRDKLRGWTGGTDRTPQTGNSF